MSDQSMQIAKTILAQLGGNKFVAMTGARQLQATGQGLTFRLPGKNFCKQDINAVDIVLDPSDTYHVTFYRIRGLNPTPISDHTGIYFDQLQELFTRVTGLDTHL